MSDGPVAETREAGGSWLRLTIDRPPGNILALEVVSGLRAALARIPATGPLKLLTLEGAGADFSFGASIEEHRPGAISRVLPETHNLIRDLLDLPVVTAAIVNGRCLGG